MKKRSLDYDGLDGILQQPDASIQSKAAWYQSGWVYGLAGIVLAGVFLLQKNSTEPLTTSNNSTEQSKSATSVVAINQKPTKPTEIQTTEATIAPDQSVTINTSEPGIKNPVQPAEVSAVSAQKSLDASTAGADKTVAQTENQAPQPSANVPPAQTTSNTDSSDNSKTEALFTVHFKFDSSKLNALSSSESAELIDAAKRCAKLIKLTGHTCNLGTDASNQILGLTRAKAVKKLLLKHGFDSSRIITTSAGMSNPRAANDTPAGQALNRRTELSCQDD